MLKKEFARAEKITQQKVDQAQAANKSMYE